MAWTPERARVLPSHGARSIHPSPTGGALRGLRPRSPSRRALMLRRPLEVPPEYVYPADEWRIVETRYCERYHARSETALALANGYVGIRGTYDEGRPALSPGTFVDGFHETWPIVH